MSQPACTPEHPYLLWIPLTSTTLTCIESYAVAEHRLDWLTILHALHSLPLVLLRCSPLPISHHCQCQYCFLISSWYSRFHLGFHIIVLTLSATFLPSTCFFLSLNVGFFAKRFVPLSRSHRWRHGVSDTSPWQQNQGSINVHQAYVIIFLCIVLAVSSLRRSLHHTPRHQHHCAHKMAKDPQVWILLCTNLDFLH